MICQYLNCDVMAIVIKYLVAIMQVLSVELDDYYLQLVTTKCLNTAVTLTYILSRENIKNIDYCEVDTINNRYKEQESPMQYKREVFESFVKDITKKEKGRFFYYILMTNNDMKGENGTAFFPGHVFIIDKIWNCEISKNVYRIYQSYINKYDLIEHYKMSEGMQLPYNNINYVIKGINNILFSPLWNEDAVTFWKYLTFVDTTELLNYETFYINFCFKKFPITTCYKQLYQFSYDSLHNIKEHINKGEMDTYNIDIDTESKFAVKQYSIEELYKNIWDMYQEVGEKIISNNNFPNV